MRNPLKRLEQGGLEDIPRLQVVAELGTHPQPNEGEQPRCVELQELAEGLLGAGPGAFEQRAAIGPDHGEGTS